MKLNTTKLLAVFARFKYGKRIYPERDWLILLLISSLLLGVSAAVNGWLYFFDSREADVATPAAVVAPSPSLLSDTDLLLQKRAEEERKYRGEYQFVDPSTQGS